MTAAYRCVACGSDRVGVSEARPSVDDRYVIGSCQPCRKSGVTLVRADVYPAAKATVARENERRDRADAARAVQDPTYKPKRKFTNERAALGKQVIEELAR